MRSNAACAVGTIAALALAGCGAATAPEPDASACGHAACLSDPALTWKLTAPTGLSSPEIDVLFVIDDTRAMAGVAANLPDQYTALGPLLGNLPLDGQEALWLQGPRPIHVAFVPSTLASADCPAVSARDAACGLASADPFLSRGACGIEPNFSRSLGETFSCLGSFGSQGCGASQPLEAARRALGADTAGGALGGRTSFVGPGAGLLIVIVTAQDDASVNGDALVPVSNYAAFFESIAPGRVAVSVVGPAASCAADGGVTAVATPRLHEMVGALTVAGVETSLCDGDLSLALLPVVESYGILRPGPCLDGIRDANSGPPDCLVQGRFKAIDGTESVVTIPVCDSTGPTVPCWSLSPTSSPSFQCPKGGRSFSTVLSCPPVLTELQIACRGCADPTDPACAGS